MKNTATERLTTARHLTKEREKELDALYALASLFARPVTDMSTVLRETARILRTSMQFAKNTGVEITTEDVSILSDRSGDIADSYTTRRTYSIEKLVAVTVSYHAAGSTDAPRKIEPREKFLIDSTATLLADVLQRREMDQTLRESTKILQSQAAELESKNTALREVLSHIEAERREITRNVRSHIDTFVEPYLHKLRKSLTLSAHDKSCIEQLENAVHDLFSSDSAEFGSITRVLSHREAEIAGLIRNGLTTKEISSFLNITEVTVERHRNTIRKKLDISGKKVSLTSYLRSLDDDRHVTTM